MPFCLKVYNQNILVNIFCGVSLIVRGWNCNTVVEVTDHILGSACSWLKTCFAPLFYFGKMPSTCLVITGHDIHGQIRKTDHLQCWTEVCSSSMKKHLNLHVLYAVAEKIPSYARDTLASRQHTRDDLYLPPVSPPLSPVRSKSEVGSLVSEEPLHDQRPKDDYLVSYMCQTIHALWLLYKPTSQKLLFFIFK